MWEAIFAPESTITCLHESYSNITDANSADFHKIDKF